MKATNSVRNMTLAWVVVAMLVAPATAWSRNNSVDCQKAEQQVDKAWDQVIGGAARKRDQLAAGLAKEMDALSELGIRLLKQAAEAARAKDPAQGNSDPSWGGATTIDQMVTQAKTAAGLAHLAVAWGASIQACAPVDKAFGSPDLVCRHGNTAIPRGAEAMCLRCNQSYSALNRLVRSLPNFGSNMDEAFESLVTALDEYNRLATEGPLDQALVPASALQSLRDRGRKAGLVASSLDYQSTLANWATERQEIEKATGVFTSELEPGPELAGEETSRLLASVVATRKASADRCTQCSTSEDCRLMGWCSSDGHGHCVAKTDADCRGSYDCKNSGRCSFGGSGCTAKTDNDCKNADVCRGSGKCVAVKGWCEFAPGQQEAFCKASDDCRRSGLCSADGGRCAAKTDADCKGSDFCKSIGNCTAYEGQCGFGAMNAAECRASKQCKVSGQCSLVGRVCRPTEESDCQQSDGCTAHGACHIIPTGRCVPLGPDDCQRTTDCMMSGRCQYNAGLKACLR